MFGPSFEVLCRIVNLWNVGGSAVNKRFFADQMQREKKKTSNVAIILEWKKTTNVVSVPCDCLDAHAGH